MAFPAVSTASETSVSTAADPHTVNRPAGVAGRLVVVLGATPTTQVAAWPAGYTQFVNIGGAGYRIIAAYHYDDGTEGSTISVDMAASTKAAWLALSLAGAQNPATQPPEAVEGSTQITANYNPPALTPTGGAKDYLWIACLAQAGEEADDDTWCTAGPTNYLPATPRQVTSGTGGAASSNASLAEANRQLNAASEDPGTFTAAQSLSTIGATIAVHPAGPTEINGTGGLVAPTQALAGAGDVDTAGSGAATAPAAVLSGAGDVDTAASGALAAPGGLLAGTGGALVQASGGIASPAGVLAGTGTVTTPEIAGSGALIAPIAALSAIGDVDTAGSGLLAASAASLSGAGGALVVGSGSLAAPTSGLSGSAGVDVAASGALVAAPATFSGVGTVTDPQIAASGVLVASGGVLAASGSVAVSSSGGLAVPAATWAGSGELPIAGSASLAPPASTLSGAGTVVAVTYGMAALAAPAASLAGSGSVEIAGSSLYAGYAALLHGTGTLDPFDVPVTFGPRVRFDNGSIILQQGAATVRREL